MFRRIWLTLLAVAAFIFSAGVSYYTYEVTLSWAKAQFEKLDAKMRVFAEEAQKMKADVVIAPKLDASCGEKALSAENIAVLLQRKYKNAIVKVVASQLTFNWQEPYKNLDQAEVRGSGFFIDEEGHFLTNFHVVGQRLRVQIQMAVFGQSKMDCEVIGVCPDRDLALLKIDEKAKERIIKKLGHIEFLKLGDSDNTYRGANVVTLGFPLGKDVIKSTTGIVSGWEDLQLGERGAMLSCLEITAPINPGSSGGPALNGKGEVIGINFAGVDKAQNVGYVLPINELKSAVPQLHAQTLVFKPHLGFVTQSTTATFEECFNNPPGGGVYIRRVLRSSLAEKVGIRAGDIIYTVNGYELDHHGDTNAPWREDKIFYSNILQRLELGDDIEIVLFRNGERKVICFKLEDSSGTVKIRARYPAFEDIDYEVFGGLVVMELSLNHVLELYTTNPQLLKYGLPQNIDEPVLIVSFVQGTSEAQRNGGGVCKGSILKKINGVPVKTLAQLRHELKISLAKEFITVTGSEQALTVFETAKLIADESRLARLFKYNNEHSLVLAKGEGLW